MGVLMVLNGRRNRESASKAFLAFANGFSKACLARLTCPADKMLISGKYFFSKNTKNHEQEGKMKHQKTFIVHLCFFLLFLSSGIGNAQEESIAKIDAYVQKAMQEWNAPSVAVSIVKNDKVIFAKGYGILEAGKPEKADEHTIYAIGSSTKAFTVASLAMLVEEKKLNWDDRVIDYLPGFQVYDPWVTRELRIRDLVTHRIGIERADMLWGGTDFDSNEILHRVRYIDPVASFRYRFGYNNLMFLAAGQIVSSLSVRSWDDFIKERIFSPLEMKTSSTTTLELKNVNNVSTPHAYEDGKAVPIPWRNIDNIGPAGAINSNVVEMAQWIRLYSGQGTYQGKKLLSPETVKEIFSPQTVIPIEKWLSSMSPVNHQMVPESHFFMYGLGWFLQDYYGRKIIHHGGSIDGMRCLVGMIPEAQLGVVILTNINPTSLTEALMFKVFDEFLGVRGRDWSAEMLAGVKSLQAKYKEAQKKMDEERVKNTKPSLPLESYTGTYEHKAYGKAEVQKQGDKLTLKAGKIQGEMIHWHFDTFQFASDEFDDFPFMASFTLNAQGKVDRMKIEGLGNFTRKEAH